MELLGLGFLGYGGKEVFNYNRENFKFDRDQQFVRESFRLKMQVLRFKLFREDVRDLVDLTVSRMDIYHLVGALFLQFCIILFCEGRVKDSAPPFVLSLFLLSTGSAFVYLLLAVWLSMHASIASHSFGVRLLTRFVRLPIASMKDIDGLRFNLKDFEGQDITNLMRVPFVGGQSWSQSQGPSLAAAAAAPRTARPPPEGLAGRPPPPPGAGSSRAAATGVPAAVSAADGTALKADYPAHWSESMPVTAMDDIKLLPEDPDFDFDASTGGEDLLDSKSGVRPERHIELFRHLQSKWQCYDAYCRVCMSMGINQILQGLSYYCICHTQVENHSPTTGYALIVMLQCTTIALAILDLSGLTEIEILLVQIVGIMPCLLTAFGIAQSKHQLGKLEPELRYPSSPFSFLCQVVWLEMWLRIASPSDDAAKLPRRFRQVLFLDVFGDAKNWDPTRPDDPDSLFGVFDPNECDEGEDHFAVASKAVFHFKLAQCAVRRWRAAPECGLQRDQRRSMSKLMATLDTWGSTIQSELCCSRRLRSIPFVSELKPWRDLSPEERCADPFSSCIVGPLEHDAGDKQLLYHYDVEHECMLFQDDPSLSASAPQRLVLTLEAVDQVVADLEREARALLEARIMSDLRKTMRRQAEGTAGALDSEFPVLASCGPSSRLARLPERCLSVARTAPGSGTNSGRRGKAVLSNFVELFRKPGAGRYQRQHDEDEGEDDEAVAQDPPAAAVAASPAAAPAAAGAASTATVVAEGLPGAEAGDAEEGQGRRPKRRRPRFRRSNKSQDERFRAVAGKHAKDFVPERLPWLVVSKMTRVLQLGWFWSGVMALLKEANVYQVDFQQHQVNKPEGGRPAGRRLATAEPLEVARLEVAWPHGPLFRPSGLHCLGRGEVLLSTPFALFLASLGSAAAALEPPRLLRPAPAARVRLPQGAAVFRGRSALPQVVPPEPLRLDLAPGGRGTAAAASCWALAPLAPAEDSGAEQVSALQLLWNFTADGSGLRSARLPLEGAPWRQLAATAVPCAGLPPLLRQAAGLDAALAAGQGMCALLAGFDGGALPLAAVSFDTLAATAADVLGRGVAPAAATAAAAAPLRWLRPGLEAPLEEADAQAGIVALGFSSDAQRLWALLVGNELLAWDLREAKALGRWQLSQPAADPATAAAQAPALAALAPRAVCEDAEHGLLVLGQLVGASHEDSSEVAVAALSEPVLLSARVAGPAV